VVISVPTAGIGERTVAKLPRWLAATFFLLPIFGLLYLAGSASAECGEGSLLRVDRITGIAVNCDGSEFTGRGAPGGQVDFLALGERVFGGQEISIVNCSACHGPQGQGGVGPAFAAVVTTFSSCLDHVEWVAKGTAGFQGEGRATYGDIEKPVGGVGTMPGFGASLTPEQLASVVAFERIRFGGGAEDTVLQDCGLVTPDEPTEGESPTATTEGETPATTTEGEASTSTPVVP
jgi:mono/diheme cytochrome c family protein